MGVHVGSLLEEKRCVQENNFIPDSSFTIWTEKSSRRAAIYVEREMWVGFTDEEILDAYDEIEK